MKKLIIIAVLLLFTGLSLTAQKNSKSFLNIDYKEMEKFAKNQPEDFTALIHRFNSGDTTLTDMEVAKIYYGSYFSADYSYKEASSELRDLLKSKSYKSVLEQCKKELEKSPCSLDLLLKAFICTSNLGESVALYSTQIEQIVGVIFSSGDGRTENTALKVLEVSDEYCIIYGILNLNLKQQALVGHCDRMTVYENEDSQNTFDIYFDVSLHLAHLDKLFGGFDKSTKKMKKSKRK
ncbi:MAG: DUF4919 domain-containing protein [Bacteroidales bacterium]|nr:DUF4919 domain-containing protein [Bacteroidales bacterium]